MKDRSEHHNSNVVSDVAAAGGCGLKNLTNGATCGLPAHHAGPCDFMAPHAVPEALREKGIDLRSDAQ
ncbi:MAG TPA: hypothetical protein VIJ96_19045 [Acidothermaceae bacterium]